MSDVIKRIIKKVAPLAFLEPESDAGIAKIGHRNYVGGLWDEIGTLQFDFLRSQGLLPHHYLLDIACGALRLGVKVIPYLDRGHYLGIEKEPGLVRAGLEEELPAEVRADKAPQIVLSDAFEFGKLGHKADFAIAQSLFSHFPAALIRECFSKLAPHMEDTGIFFATYFETKVPARNPDKPHDHGYFAYTRDEMCAFGESTGWQARYIGDWNHPREQVMVEYRKKPRTS